MIHYLFQYFTDPIFRAPMIASILMCLSTAIIGSLVFVKRHSLVGETLSHATYPGIVLGMSFSFLFFSSFEKTSSLIVMLGAFVFAFLGLGLMNVLIKKYKVSNDAALSFILSSFFGFGLLLMSYLQGISTQEYRMVHLYLFGQVATLMDEHIVMYSGFAILVLGFVGFVFPQIEAVYFQRDFAKSVGLKVRAIEGVVFMLLVSAIVISMRSVGIILMAGMLIAPAIAARQFTNRLSTMIFLSAIFGVLSGFLGNICSIELSKYFGALFSKDHISLPMGPFIMLFGSLFAMLSLLFAPKKGVAFRLVRFMRFKWLSLQENILKSFIKLQKKQLNLSQIAKKNQMNRWLTYLLLWNMQQQKWVWKTGKSFYALSELGKQKAHRILHLHKLWEIYLEKYLGGKGEKIHHNAEEMEHIITADLETRLGKFLLQSSSQKKPGA